MDGKQHQIMLYAMQKSSDKFFCLEETEKENQSTDLGSSGVTRKPEASNGASSAKDSSIGAKTSCAHAPGAFSSTPVQSCIFQKISQFQYVQY